jgi:hypothetical protein
MADNPQPEPHEQPEPSGSDPGYGSVHDFLLYSLSLPERALRSASSVVGETLRESAALLVPQAFQSSKTYTVLVGQMLDFLAEDIGGVRRSEGEDDSAKVEDFVARKAVGNFIEMAGLATLHLSPLTVLAVSSAITLHALGKIGTLGEGALSTVRVAGTLLDRHVVNHYTRALDDIRRKGIYASLAESSKPYVEAVWMNFSTEKTTLTEDLLSGKLIGQAWGATRRWLGGEA